MDTLKAYSKRFAAWVIALRNRFQTDIYFKTKVTIIGLQSVFIVAVILVVGIFQSASYNALVSAVFDDITNAVKENRQIVTTDIAETTLSAGFVNLGLVLLLLSLMGGGFGYVIAQLVLSPTKRALDSQKRFIGDIAHELRTPLSVLKTNAEVMLRREELPEPLRKQTLSNVEEIDSISGIINNLLSFNNFTRPERMAFGDVDLGAVSDKVVHTYHRVIREKNLEVVVQKSEYRTVWGNATALEQVLSNLVKNAVSYTPAGGQVTITLEPDYNGFMELSVRDTGIGISKKDLFHIFEPFYRADLSRSKRDGGSGLGLAIASEIVKIHNGKITIRSSLGKGTIATVLLPCGSVPGERTQREEYLHEISVDFLRGRESSSSPSSPHDSLH